MTPRILIVDDKEENRYLLRVLFERTGYAVDEAPDGERALAVARDRPPDVVLSDILMPVMDGFTLCREWRKDDRLKALPFVFYTATYTDPRDEELARKLGAEAFLVKPVEPKVLTGTVDEILARHGPRNAPGPGAEADDEKAFLKTYNESLVRKIEDKLEFFKAAFDIDPSLIVTLSPSRRILELNRAAAALCGDRPEAAVGADFLDVFVPETRRAAFRDRLAAALSGERVRDFECVLRVPDGGERTILWNARRFPHSAEAMAGLLLIGHDVTERARAERERQALETQLYQAQKMEALGVFSAGIAHDFNNILTGIVGFVDLAREAASEGSPGREHLDCALAATERARHLVARILSMAHGGHEGFREVDPAGLIREAGTLLRASIPRSIELALDAEEDCGSILCEPTQIHQVILNLCTNAYHAIGSGTGRIGVTCRVSEGQDGVPDRAAAPPDARPDVIPGSFVAIEVTDTGKGMSEAVRKRIFDPYFTTKENGTGLGLAVVAAIVHAHGGRIRVESAEGRGSTFRVLLPRRASGEAAGLTDGAGTWETGRNESILLVEDDETNGPMLVNALTALKYRVTFVSNGPEALALFGRLPRRYDALIADLTMPKMGGLELAGKIRALRPDIPVLLMSGRPENAPEPRLEPPGLSAFIKKPFDIGELSRALNGLLSRSAGDGTPAPGRR